MPDTTHREMPIPMILHCPKCGLQHVDAPDFEDDPSMLAVGITHKSYDGWTNPPHRSHLCHGCGHIWRPADVPTEGVKAIQTRGKSDSPAVENLYRHTGGNIYEKLSELKAKVGESGWCDCVRYRSVDTDHEYVTDMQRWNASFTLQPGSQDV